MRDLTTPPPFPTLVASVRELENLVSRPVEAVERQLVEIANDPDRSTWNLGTALREPAAPGRNTLLDEAWAAYPLLQRER